MKIDWCDKCKEARAITTICAVTGSQYDPMDGHYDITETRDLCAECLVKVYNKSIYILRTLLQEKGLAGFNNSIVEFIDGKR